MKINCFGCFGVIPLLGFPNRLHIYIYIYTYVLIERYEKYIKRDISYFPFSGTREGPPMDQPKLASSEGDCAWKPPRSMWGLQLQGCTMGNTADCDRGNGGNRKYLSDFGQNWPGVPLQDALSILSSCRQNLM